MHFLNSTKEGDDQCSYVNEKLIKNMKNCAVVLSLYNDSSVNLQFHEIQLVHRHTDRLNCALYIDSSVIEPPI